MRKTWMIASLMAMSTVAQALDDYGYVDFNRILTSSTRAKQEEKTLQALQKELEEQVNSVEKEMTSLAEKLQDPDYLDSLSQEAEQEQRNRLRTMAEERMRLIQQVSGQFQQAQQRIAQQLQMMVRQASAEVAKKKKLRALLNGDALFYADPALDYTDAVVELLDGEGK
jgi:outer membrane protein